MYLIKGFGFGGVFDKFNVTKRQDSYHEYRGLEMTTGRGSTGSSCKLRFHAEAFGKAISFNEDFSVAQRDERYFEHSVVFSNRPIAINETIAVEILKVSSDFHGPLRIGLTTCDPSSFERGAVPLGRDLKYVSGFWVKGVQLFPMNVGTIVYFKVSSDGVVFYGVNGENGGVFLRDVNVSQRLWVVLEAYGSVQSLKFVDKSMPLGNLSSNGINPSENSPPINSLNNGGARIRPFPRVMLRPSNILLSTRRNVRLAPLQNITSNSYSSGALSPQSPMTPAFASPIYNPGVCIICTDREKNTAFSKCGHLCMCYECAVAYKNQNSPSGRSRNGRRKNFCPICRQPILSVLRVYA